MPPIVEPKSPFLAPDASAKLRNRAGDVFPLLLVAAMIATFVRDALFLFAEPYPYGIDGYYYSALAAGSAPGRSAAPLPNLFLRMLNGIVGADTAPKIAGLMFLYGAGGAAFYLVRRNTADAILGTLAFFLVVKGYMRADLLVNFLKQSFGQLLVLTLAACLVAAPWPKRGRAFHRRMAAIMLILLAAAFSHLMSVALGLLFALAWLAHDFLTRTGVRRPLTIIVGAAWPLTWLGVYFFARNPEWARGWHFLVDHSTTPQPQFNLPFAYDAAGPITQVVPANFIITLALIIAVVALLATACRIEPQRDAQPARYRAVLLAVLFLPQVLLTFSPFFVPGDIYRVGIHMRLICALGIAAAVIIPAALAAAPVSPWRRHVIALALIVVLLVPPPAWPQSARPIPDGGALHNAMLGMADEVPDDAIVITSLRIGNMVTALWEQPRLEFNRFDPPGPVHRMYRLIPIDPQVQNALKVFQANQPELPPTIAIHGPWLLISEATYRAFRDFLAAEHPDLHRLLLQILEG